MEQRFLIPSPSYDEMRVLLAIHKNGSVRLPLDPRELPASSLEHLPIARLIEDKILEIRESGGGQTIGLTPLGMTHMRRLVIDYHLELMSLRKTSDDFFRDRVKALSAASCRRILLYGASDTARALIEFLQDSTISVVGIVDDDSSKHGLLIGGVQVFSPADIINTSFDTLVVTAVAFEQEILRKTTATVPPERKIVGLFEIA